MVCLIFFFFFLNNHKIKNRCLATQSSLFKQFFSRVALYPNFRRISLECFFFSSFVPSSKILPSLSRNVGNTYTHGAQTHASVKGFSLSQFSFLGTFVSSIFIHSCHGFESYLKWTIFQPRSFCVLVSTLVLKILAYVFHHASWLSYNERLE